MAGETGDICQYIERSRALASVWAFPMKGFRGSVSAEATFLAKKRKSTPKNAFGNTCYWQNVQQSFVLPKLFALKFSCAKIS